MEIQKTEHPCPERVRENWLTLNGEWEFSFEEPTFNKKINVPFSWTCELSGINAPEKKGVGYYRKRISYPVDENRLFLIFCGVDYECEVAVNGVSLTKHLGGYARFEVEVTEVWQNDMENEIVVKAVDFDYDYQTYGKQGYGNIRGIWQSVYLEARPQSYIDSFFIKTKIDGTVSVEVKSEGDFNRIRAEFEGISAESKTNNLTLNFNNPKLWSPDEPNLYEGYIELVHNGDRDRIYTYFGIREIGTGRLDANGNQYILLNHKPIYLNGVLDQGYNPQGYFTLPSDVAVKEEIEQTKALGLNMTRFHIKWEEPRKIYWADKLGLLVMADIPCFWGEPTAQARELFEEQMEECILRDINHPSIFYWVIFNETWGLKTFKKDENGNLSREYEFEKDTQEWVRKCYYKVKQLDGTRLVEDNSPCNRDHVETDVNTWHFYINGHEWLKQHLDNMCASCVEGAEVNYIGGNTMSDIPLMNSECGNYWGVQGNSGDSDISWHYKYMMNEFRLHDRICGFVFTELKDVINEFNGYYRIDNTKKFFGYDYFVPGMTVADLHGQDFIAYDYAPMTTVSANEKISVPIYISSFDNTYHGSKMRLYWECVLYAGGETRILESAEREFSYTYGKTAVGTIDFITPDVDGIICVRLYLKNETDEIIARNFCLFDNCGKTESLLRIEPAELKPHGFEKVWQAQGGRKVNAYGEGWLEFSLKKSKLPNWRNGLCIQFEASSRELLSKDCGDAMHNKIDLDLMKGYQVDRGGNSNSFYMTDEEVYESAMQVLVEDIVVADLVLPDCPADCSGALSWHYQESDDLLDEAGSYGYLYQISVGKDILSNVGEEFTVKFQTKTGFSLFGRQSGKYATGIEMK